MKNLLLLIVFSVASFHVHAFRINPEKQAETKRNFERIFEQAKSVKWNFSQKMPMASFILNGVQKKARFNTEGELAEVISYYKEDGLPHFVCKDLKTRFADDSVWGVTEVASDNKTHYVVVLKNAKDWKHVLYNGDDYNGVIKKFRQN